MRKDLIEKYQNDHNYKRWVQNFLALKKYKDKHKKWPISDIVLPNGFYLGKWCITQRGYYKNKKLHNWKIELLNSIDFIWHSTRSWEYQFENFKRWVSVNGKLPESHSKDTKELQFYSWMIRQRTEFNQKRLDSKRAKLLNDLGTFYDYDDKVWFENLKAVKLFIEKNSRYPLKKSDNANERKLSVWLMSFRSMYIRGEMQYHRAEAFKKNNFDVNYRDYLWFSMFEKCDAFIKKHNRVPKQTGENKEEDKLAKWRYHQNNVYNNGKMSKDKAKLYKESKLLITDFDSSWHKRLKKVIHFYKLMGYWPQAKVKDKDEAYLGDWVQKMRVYYKQNIYLDNTKRQVLVSSGVLDSTRNKSAWNENYEKLEDFVKTYNRMPEYESNGDEKYLYNWYREKLYQTKTTLITDRQKKLILKYEDQFVSRKKRREIKWRARYNQVKSFVEKNDRMPKRNLNDELEKKLFEWLLYQRRRIREKSLNKTQLRLMDLLPE